MKAIYNIHGKIQYDNKNQITTYTFSEPSQANGMTGIVIVDGKIWFLKGTRSLKKSLICIATKKESMVLVACLQIHDAILL